MQAGRAASEEGRAGGPGTGEGLLRGRRHVCPPVGAMAGVEAGSEAGRLPRIPYRRELHEDARPRASPSRFHHSPLNTHLL